MSFDTPTPPYSASDPYATFLAASCFEHLVIELVPLAERMARRLEDNPEPVGGIVKSTNASVTGGSTSGTMADRDDERVREAMYFRLDSLGYRVGQGLAER